MIFPIQEKFRITQGFKSTHDAIDVAPEIPGKRGVKIVSPEPAVVIRSEYSRHNPSWPLDNWVIIKGKTSNEYFYFGHMESRAVKVGQTLSEGQLIGIMGTTGKSTGIHTHIEVRTTTYARGHDVIGHFKSYGIDVYKEAQVDRTVDDCLYKGKDASGWYKEVERYKKLYEESLDRAKAHQKTINDLKVALENEKNKPPIEIIKEVEVIVEKPVTLPPVTVPDEPPITPEPPGTSDGFYNWLKNLLERIFK